MSLSRALVQQFSRNTRAKGEQYALSRRVDILSGSGLAVVARVRGTETYRVTITRTNQEDGHVEFDVSCECPYYDREYDPCKHLWATFRVAEQRGHLNDGPLLDADHTASLELLPPDGGFASDRADVDGPLVMPARLDAAKRRAQTTPAPNPGGRFLAAVERQLVANSLTPPPAFRYTSDELIYVFEAANTPAPAGLAVSVMARRRKKNGDWSKPKIVSATRDEAALAPEADRALLIAMMGAAHVEGEAWYPAHHVSSSRAAAFVLSGALLQDIAPRIAQTGRAFLRVSPSDVRPVRWDDGPAWTFEVEVMRTLHGARVGGALVREGDRLSLSDVTLLVPHAFVFARGLLARLDAHADVALAAELRAAGEVDVDESHFPRLAHVLALARVPNAALPAELHVDVIDAAPVPRLMLTALTESTYEKRLEAAVSFDYDGSIVRLEDPPSVFDASRRRVVRRRMADEVQAIQQLDHLQFQHGWDHYARRPRLEIATRVALPAISQLINQGWRVEGQGQLYRLAGTVQMSVSSGIDWFDLDASVGFDDQTVPLGDVLAALTRGEQTVLLGDGSYGVLPQDWLRRYLPLAAAAENTDGHLRFRRPQVALLDALLADAAVHTAVTLDEGFARARQELSRINDIAAVDPPASFIGTLREYQREGLAWLQFLSRVGFGGCLADDMGLGKTVMVLALLASRHDSHGATPGGSQPSLAVVPRSLVPNWIAEATRFTPSLRVLDYSRANRKAATPDLSSFDLVLITYGTLRRDALRLKDVQFDYVILDEAQAIKNPSTASAKSARLLRGKHRLALSGTPVENHLGELWSVFEFLNPGVLGASAFFQRAVTAATPDAETTNVLARGLRPFILRRTKAQVAKELPAKTEQTILCELSPRERTFYDGVRKHYRDSVLKRVEKVGMKQSQMHILEALLRLRQAACHTGLVDRDRLSESSAKLDILVPRLREVIDEGHKALVFSQFTSLLAIVRRQLDAQGMTYEYLDGRTRQRGAKVEHFQQDPDCRLFLISLKAGGLGLNLTAAEYVFLLDPWWNPAVEAQAIDRAHRIGQTREVFAYRLIARDTVEEKLLELQRVKRDLADAILSAGATSLRHLQREDLDLLLS